MHLPHISHRFKPSCSFKILSSFPLLKNCSLPALCFLHALSHWEQVNLSFLLQHLPASFPARAILYPYTMATVLSLVIFALVSSPSGSSHHCDQRPRNVDFSLKALEAFQLTLWTCPGLTLALCGRFRTFPPAPSKSYDFSTHFGQSCWHCCVHLSLGGCLFLPHAQTGKPGQGRSILRCPSCLGWNCKFRVIKEGTRQKWTFEQNHYMSGDCVCVCVCIGMYVWERDRVREINSELIGSLPFIIMLS